MLNTDAISLYYFLCANVCFHLLEFTNVWLSTTMLSSKLNFLIFFNLLVGNFCFNLSYQLYFFTCCGDQNGGSLKHCHVPAGVPPPLKM